MEWVRMKDQEKEDNPTHMDSEISNGREEDLTILCDELGVHAPCILEQQSLQESLRTTTSSVKLDPHQKTKITHRANHSAPLPPFCIARFLPPCSSTHLHPTPDESSAPQHRPPLNRLLATSSSSLISRFGNRDTGPNHHSPPASPRGTPWARDGHID